MARKERKFPKKPPKKPLPLKKKKPGLVAAEIVKVNGTFGFARPVNAEKDVFVPGKLLAGALPGDQVMLRVAKGTGELPEGEVAEITKAANVQFSAVLEIDFDGTATVQPDRYLRYPVRVKGSLLGAKNGDKVLCEITERGARHSEHRARIVEVFGSADSAAACSRAVLAANGVHTRFPDEVLKQAKAVAETDVHPKEILQRLDLRDDLIFTIDGADSKDLDDAISLRKRTNGGWTLGVHIADVSYYVLHKSPLDEEAFDRGTSVYYADSVVPMLPPELSNGICSLNQ
jgi:ribonuclease R